MVSPWNQHHWSGTAADFHALDPVGERGLWWCNVSRAALIVGSSQSVELIDSECAVQHEIDVVRRRSGGGLVFVHPTDSIWLDITIPKDDPLWTDDVSSSMLWLGDVFVHALSPWVNATVFRSAFVAGDYGRDVCFASHSPGEVFVGDRKLVGISQRRTRDGARFQCVLYRHWNSDSWLSCIASPHAADGVKRLHVATLDADADAVVSAVVNALPL
jgi:lipoate-protein ligase A